MRACLMILMLTINGVLVAGNTSGQDLSNIKISVELKNVSLKTAIRKIEALSHLSFSYKTSDVSTYNGISYSAAHTGLDKVLSGILENTDLQYEVVNSNIIIKKSKITATYSGMQDLNIIQADGGIKGRVTTAAGEPVPNATVMLLGTQKVSVANDNGEFTISGVKAGGYKLQISAVGFGTITQNVTVADNAIATADVLMLEDKSNLTEVTVTALGIKKEKRSLGYAAQEVSSEALSASKQVNVVNALQGQAAGLQINSGGGAPGQGAKIILRGINSLDANRDFQPLFVIDGVPIDNSTDVADGSDLMGMSNRAADINPDDIESINILKGGAATALYGLRASTGAIVITTKSGKAGRLKANYTSTYSIDEINKYPETQKKFTQGWFGEYVPSGPDAFWPAYGPTIAEAKAIDPTHPDELFNNYKHGYKTGNSFRNTITLSGGTDKAVLNGSVSQFNQEGIMPFTDYKNYSAKVGGELKFSEKFRAGMSVNYIKSGGRRGNSDRYNEALTYYSPRRDVWEYIKPDGTEITIDGAGIDNPIYLLYGRKYVDDVDRVISNAHFTYSPVKWLDFNYRLGFDIYNDKRTQTTPGPLGVPDEVYPQGDFESGTMMVYNINNRIMNSTLMMNIHNNIGAHLQSSFKIGHDLYEKRRTSSYINAKVAAVPTFYNLSNYQSVEKNSYESDYRIIGLFGDWTLSWDNFLYLTVTGRNDWTSTLSKANRSFFYPSASLSWVFSENIRLPEWWSYGKARFSVAKIGKDAPSYATSTGYDIGTALTTGALPFTLSTQNGDLNLRPEFTTSYEGGVELKFLHNRLGLDFTYYNNTSKDLIIPVSVPVTSGYSSIYLNSGSIRNKGVEISLSGTPIQTKDFSWDLRINYTANRNKVLSIYPELTEMIMATHYGYLSATVTQKNIPGHPVGDLYGRTYKRYFGTDTEDPAVLDKSRPLIIGSNGFPELNSATKQQYIANSQPKWIGNLSSTLRYKGLSLYFLFDAQQGVWRYNQFANFLASFALQKGAENRNDIIVFDGVLADGSKNTKAVWLGQGVGPDGADYGNGYYRNVYRGASETFIEDASWIRLRTLSLGYTLPESLVKRSGFIQGANINVTGTNLWINTKYSTFDPESSSFSSGSVVDGFAGFTYPATRSFIISLNLNF
ncbi:MAG: SusC/RagA family TonB-linked outer membrane protein [Agriterribacter sp.]